MPSVLQWSLRRIIRMVTAILLNRFDLFLVIEGNRGLGKSTLGFHLAKGVANEFKRLYRFDEKTVMYYYEAVKKPAGFTLEEFVEELMNLKEKRAYRFLPNHCILYTRKEVLRFFHRWNAIGMADEMINVSFNRDFYNEEQKDLIKMINMNRDHSNLFIACVPQFQNLDSQIKGLSKVRLTVVRRGIAIIQTPNRTIYSKDRWDTAVNEKIERDWIRKGVQNPHYAKLTTFRGMVRFPPLTKKHETLYQKIKDEQRNIVAQDQMGLKEEKEKDPLDLAVEMLEKNQIRNSQVIDGIALASGRSPEAFKQSMSKKLKKLGKPHRISEYYWDKKKQQGIPDEDW